MKKIIKAVVIGLLLLPFACACALAEAPSYLPRNNIDAALLALKASDYATARQLFVKEANKGNATALYELGLMSELGLGAAPNLGDAVGWYEGAAAAGDRSAMLKLAAMVHDGRGTQKNLKRTASLYQRAIDAGSVSAATALGKMYRDGDGVRRDYRKAFGLFKFAAEKGDPNALLGMGSMYWHGRGVERDDAKAFALWMVASEAGVSAAADKLDKYRKRLRDPDYEKAKKLAKEYKRHYVLATHDAH